MSRLLPALALALVVATPPCRAESAAAAPGRSPGGARLLVVGLDGADWQIADPLIAEGKLPNLEKLRRTGAWGDLRSISPMLSPLLWTSIATGKRPDVHGVTDFLVVDPSTGKRVPITSTYRKVKALWNIYSESGLTVDVIGWWATWPAEPINGHMVSDRFSYSLFGFRPGAEETASLVHPPAYIDRLDDLRVGDSQITLDMIRRFVPITAEELAAARARLEGDADSSSLDPIGHLIRILSATRSYHAAALDRLGSAPPDLLAVYYQGIDEVCHRFGHYIPPRLPWVEADRFEKFKDVVTRFYEYQDDLLGELLNAAAPGTTVVVISDHGFLNGTDRPDFPADLESRAGAWHRTYGVIVLSGEGIRRGRLEPSSLYDVAPTLLYLGGLPVAADMEGRPILDAVTAERRSRLKVSTVASYEDPGWRGAPAGEAAARIDEEMLERLRSLGYISGTESPADPPAGTQTTMSSLRNTAASQLASGEFDLAKDTSLAMLERDPSDPRAHEFLSESLEGGGLVDKAFEEARVALELDPEPSERLVSRYATLSSRLGRLEEAESFLRSYVGQRPGLAEPWIGLGNVQSMSGRWEAAEGSYFRALELDARSTGAVTGLSNVFERGDRSTQALAAIRQAVDRNPDSATHRMLLGMVLFRMRDISGAEAELRRSLDLDPESDPAIAGMADVLLELGRPEEARDLLERAIARDAGRPEVRLALGRLYSKMGRLGESLREMSRAVALDPYSPAAHGQYGIILSMLERGDEAARHLRRALELDPQLHDIRLHLAVLYHEMDRFPECEEELKRAIQERPDHPEPHRLLASLYRELGRHEEAEREMSILKGLEP